MRGPVAAASDPPPEASRAAAPAAALAAPALGSLLDALSDVRTVELQLSLPVRDRRPASDALGLDALEPEISEIAFVDTPDLSLLRGGVVVRARRTQDRPADLTVTLLWADPASLPPELRRLPGFRVDIDLRPRGYACSCSLEVPVSDRTMEALLSGDLPAYQVLTAHQRRLVSAHAPVDVATYGLAVLGPTHVLTHRLAAPGLKRGLVAERWFLPGGSRCLHLSARCKPAKVLRTATRVEAHLTARGVVPTPAPETTTRSALAALAGRPKPPGPPQPANTRRHGTAAGRSPA